MSIPVKPQAGEELFPARSPRTQLGPVFIWLKADDIICSQHCIRGAAEHHAWLLVSDLGLVRQPRGLSDNRRVARTRSAILVGRQPFNAPVFAFL